MTDSEARNSDEVIEFELGVDLFKAQMILAECRAAGFTVELLSFHATAGHPGVAPILGQQHRLLVHATDQLEVELIIAGAQ